MTSPPYVVFGDHDQATIDQLARCLADVDGARGALMPDGHLGYSAPIGGVMAYPEHVSPSGVGYDIGCGNKAVLTNLFLSDLEDEEGAGGQVIAELMDRIYAEVSFGMGRKNPAPVDHPVLDQIRNADFAPQRALLDLAATQLGTVGAGNHYVDLFADEHERIWIGVHFGSRGFGHKTASGFLALAQGGQFTDQAPHGEMTAPPTLLHASSDLGQSYIAAMQLAGAYAYAGRDVVVEKVLEILGTVAVDEVHNHHNYAWWEAHDGQAYWVVRKGATPAFAGQRGFVGATMGEPSVILEGVAGPQAEQTIASTVHGAGRVMSRTAAAGKRRKRWTCNNRDCEWWQGPDEHPPEGGVCPRCGHPKVSKQWQQMATGAINWPAVTADLAARGIELRGAAADEAPGAYKRLPEVLAHLTGSVRVLHTLRPIGVAMAGPDINDPFKD